MVGYKLEILQNFNGSFGGDETILRSYYMEVGGSNDGLLDLDYDEEKLISWDYFVKEPREATFTLWADDFLLDNFLFAGSDQYVDYAIEGETIISDINKYFVRLKGGAVGQRFETLFTGCVIRDSVQYDIHTITLKAKDPIFILSTVADKILAASTTSDDYSLGLIASILNLKNFIVNTIDLNLDIITENFSTPTGSIEIPSWNQDISQTSLDILYLENVGGLSEDILKYTRRAILMHPYSNFLSGVIMFQYGSCLFYDSISDTQYHAYSIKSSLISDNSNGGIGVLPLGTINGIYQFFPTGNMKYFPFWDLGRISELEFPYQAFNVYDKFAVIDSVEYGDIGFIPFTVMNEVPSDWTMFDGEFQIPTSSVLDTKIVDLSNSFVSFNSNHSSNTTDGEENLYCQIDISILNGLTADVQIVNDNSYLSSNTNFLYTSVVPVFSGSYTYKDAVKVFLFLNDFIMYSDNNGMINITPNNFNIRPKTISNDDIISIKISGDTKSDIDAIPEAIGIIRPVVDADGTFTTHNNFVSSVQSYYANLLNNKLPQKADCEIDISDYIINIGDIVNIFSKNYFVNSIKEDFHGFAKLKLYRVN